MFAAEVLSVTLPLPLTSVCNSATRGRVGVCSAELDGYDLFSWFSEPEPVAGVKEVLRDEGPTSTTE